jgi:hypothetical protein
MTGKVLGLDKTGDQRRWERFREMLNEALFPSFEEGALRPIN